jgi:hypothetical protein
VVPIHGGVAALSVVTICQWGNISKLRAWLDVFAWHPHLDNWEDPNHAGHFAQLLLFRQTPNISDGIVTTVSFPRANQPHTIVFLTRVNYADNWNANSVNVSLANANAIPNHISTNGLQEAEPSISGILQTMNVPLNADDAWNRYTVTLTPPTAGY